MSYYQFNKQEILQKAKVLFAEYYSKDKEATCQKKKKTKLKCIKEKDIINWFSTKKKHYKIKWVSLLISIKISKKILKFDNIRFKRRKIS